MTQFNINRFGKLLVWTAQSNRKDIASTLATVFIIFFAFQMIPAIQCLGDTDSMPVIITNWTGVASIVLGVLIWVSGTFIFKNMRTKEQRISYLMVPATDLEKWLARIVYIFAVYFIGLNLAYIAADVLRMGFFQLFYGDYFLSSTTDIWGSVNFTSFPMSGKYYYMINIAAIILVVWSHSVYLLGGTLFRKQPFILTSLAMFALNMILGTVVSLINNFVPIFYYLGEWDADIILGILAFIGLALTVMNYWLSYKIFSHMQVINNKWLNIL